MSRLNSIESVVWLLMIIHLQINNEKESSGTERNTKCRVWRKTLGGLMLQQRHLMEGRLQLLRRLVSLRRGLLCTEIKRTHRDKVQTYKICLRYFLILRRNWISSCSVIQGSQDPFQDGYGSRPCSACSYDYAGSEWSLSLKGIEYWQGKLDNHNICSVNFRGTMHARVEEL